jgi:hypothetical protein
MARNYNTVDGLALIRYSSFRSPDCFHRNLRLCASVMLGERTTPSHKISRISWAGTVASWIEVLSAAAAAPESALIGVRPGAREGRRLATMLSSRDLGSCMSSFSAMYVATFFIRSICVAVRRAFLPRKTYQLSSCTSVHGQLTLKAALASVEPRYRTS